MWHGERKSWLHGYSIAGKAAKIMILSNLLLSFNVVLPLFLEMLLGNWLKRVRLLENETVKSLNKATFKCFLPILLFYNIYTSNFRSDFNLRLILYVVGCVLILFSVLMLVIPSVEKDNRKRGVLVQAGFRSNFVLFGLPLSASLTGTEAPRAASLLIAIIVPMYNILAVVALERFRGENIRIKNIARGIITNPLVAASTAAVLCHMLQIKLPVFLYDTLSGLAKIATPFSLILLGAEFCLKDTKRYQKQLLFGIVLRLCIIPAVFLPLTIWFGFKGNDYIPLMILFSAPVGVSSYTMAEMMDGDGPLASQIVFYSTACSVVTLFFIIFISKTLGFF